MNSLKTLILFICIVTILYMYYFHSYFIGHLLITMSWRNCGTRPKIKSISEGPRIKPRAVRLQSLSSSSRRVPWGAGQEDEAASYMCRPTGCGRLCFHSGVQPQQAGKGECGKVLFPCGYPTCHLYIFHISFLCVRNEKGKKTSNKGNFQPDFPILG